MRAQVADDAINYENNSESVMSLCACEAWVLTKDWERKIPVLEKIYRHYRKTTRIGWIHKIKRLNLR